MKIELKFPSGVEISIDGVPPEQVKELLELVKNATAPAQPIYVPPVYVPTPSYPWITWRTETKGGTTDATQA